jgi:hypothetical protein
LKHDEKLELIVKKLLEESLSQQVLHDDPSKETGDTYRAENLLEEMALLHSELREQYLQLKVQLQHRLEELQRKLQAVRPSLDAGSAEEQITGLLNESPQNSRELWCELKDEHAKLKDENAKLKDENPKLKDERAKLMDENAKLKNKGAELKEQIGVLSEHIKQEGEIEIAMDSNQGDCISAENIKLKKQVAELKNKVRKTVGICDKGVLTNLTMFTPVKTENQMEMELNEEDKLEHKIQRNVQEQETVTEPTIWEQSPHQAHEMLLELRNENVRLQRQIDLLVEHIKDKEDVINKESITEIDTGTVETSGELLMENLKLKQHIILPTENIKQNHVIEQETVTEPIAYELPEQYKDLLNKLRIENVKLQDQIHLCEVHLKAKEAMEDREVMTDPLKWQEEQKWKDENSKLEADMLLLQNKIRQHNKDFREDGREVGATPWYISDQCAVVSGTCSPNKVLLVKGQSQQEASNEKLTDQRIMAVENLLAENRELKRQLESVSLELEEFHSRTMIHDVQPLKTGIHNVQTMTDPDIELLHVTMENAALQAQLQQLSKEYKKKGDELERMSVLMKESREASSLQLKETQDAHAHENTLVKKELEEMKRKVKHQQQEILKSRAEMTKEHQPIKITELCNLLDHLRKENIELKAQLTEKEDKKEFEYGCHNLHQNQEVSKDHSAGNIDDKVATNKNPDSLAHLLSMGCSVSLEEAQQRRTVSMKASNIGIMDTGIQSRAGNLFPFCNVATANQDEPKFSVRTNDRCESELSFSDISAMNRAKQNSPSAEHKCQIPINANRKEQELQNIDSTKSQISKYCGPSVQCRCIGSKRDETECCMLKNSQDPSLFSNGKMGSGDMPSDFCEEQAEADCVSKLPVTSAEGSGVTVKHQQMYKDNSSCSSEIFLDSKHCQTQMSCGLSSESTNSDLVSVSQERACRTKFRPCRDAATNTTPSVQNLELQRELQLEKDRCRKYQQNIKKLKSDIQLLKNKLGESRKQGKIESNLALKQNNTNNNSLLTGMQSPSHYDSNMAEFQRQVSIVGDHFLALFLGDNTMLRQTDFLIFCGHYSVHLQCIVTEYISTSHL